MSDRIAANTRRLVIEAPDTGAVVDFISAGVTVSIAVTDTAVEIYARVSHGEGSSSWDEADFALPLPPITCDACGRPMGPADIDKERPGICIPCGCDIDEQEDEPDEAKQDS